MVKTKNPYDEEYNSCWEYIARNADLIVDAYGGQYIHLVRNGKDIIILGAGDDDFKLAARFAPIARKLGGSLITRIPKSKEGFACDLRDGDYLSTLILSPI